MVVSSFKAHESGTHLLLGEQTEFLKSPMYKLCFEPRKFSPSDEYSTYSAAVPLLARTLAMF